MYLLVVATQIILDMLVNMTVNTEQLSMAHANVTIVIMIIPAHYHAPALGTVLTGHVIVDLMVDEVTIVKNRDVQDMGQIAVEMENVT
jgi:predicted dinucleotide-binding enzyme